MKLPPLFEDPIDPELLRALARLLSSCQSSSAGTHDTVIELSRTSTRYSPPYWLLMDIQRWLGEGDALTAIERWEAAGELQPRILEVPHHQREEALEDTPELRSEALAYRLLRSEKLARLRHIGLALALAETAVTVARSISVSAEDGASGPANLLALALGRQGNMLRIAGRLEEAHECLVQAFEAEPTCQHTCGELFTLRGILLLDIGQLADAETDLRESEKAFQIESHLSAQPLLMAAKLWRDRGEAGEASIQMIHDALERLDSLRDPELFLAAKLNLSLHLTDHRQADQALEIWLTVPTLEEPANDLRRIAIGGEIHLAIGQLAPARKCFERVIDGFQGMAMPCDVAFFCLFLSLVSLLEGNSAAALDLAIRAARVFQTSGSERGSWACVQIMGAVSRADFSETSLRTLIQECRRGPDHKPDPLRV